MDGNEDDNAIRFPHFPLFFFYSSPHSHTMGTFTDHSVQFTKPKILRINVTISVFRTYNVGQSLFPATLAIGLQNRIDVTTKPFRFFYCPPPKNATRHKKSFRSALGRTASFEERPLRACLLFSLHAVFATFRFIFYHLRI